MGASPVSATVITFGEFEAHLRAHELRRKGARVRLPEQSFLVLAMLLEQPGELVAREEIRKRLWPGDTFVDFDHGLNNAVNRLREALGDSAEAPRFIETLPKRGYRFIPAVNGGGAPFASASASPVGFGTDRSGETRTQPGLVGQSETRRKNPGRYWLLLAASLILVLTTLLIDYELHKAPVPPLIRSFVLPPQGTTFNLTGDDGGAVALSPDGTKIAFVALNARNEAQIWVRPLGKLNADVIEGTEGASFPFWSPDGEFIGFFAGGKLKKVSLRGETPVVLCDAPFGRGGSWNRRGVIIFAPASHTAIYRVTDSGGTPRPITFVNTEIHTTHRWPKFLPDGVHFLYLAATHATAGPDGRSGNHNGIYLGSLEAEPDLRQDRLLIATDADATFVSGYLFFLDKDILMAQPFDVRRGELSGQARPTVEKVLYDPSTWKVVFDASENGVMAYESGAYVRGTQYRWYDRSGNQIGLLGDPDYHTAPRFSPDGRELAEGIGGTAGNIWVYDLSHNVRSPVTSDGPQNPQNNYPVWMPDSKRLLIASKAQHYSLYQVKATGASRKQPVPRYRK